MPQHGGGLAIQARSQKLKFLRTRSKAVKEIEEWAKEGRSGNAQTEVAIGRNAGTQLSDNITEERMLQARLMELSKERYKFINHISYERKMFLERQQRKSAALNDKLKNVSLDTSRFKSKSASTATTASRRSLHDGKRPHHVRKRSIKRASTSWDAHDHEEEEKRRPQTVPPRLQQEMPHIDIPPQTPPIFQTEPVFTGEGRFSGPGEGGLPRLSTPSRVKFREPRPPPRSQTWQAERPGNSTTPGGIAPAPPALPVTHDPRYKLLERSLSENYLTPAPPPGERPCTVADIVNKIESLNVKAKVHREPRPKLAQKAYEFLSKGGYMVNV